MAIFHIAFAVLNLALTVYSYGQYGQNSNACVDSCGDSFDVKYNIDLTDGKFSLKDSHLIEVLEENIKSDDQEQYECSQNVLLRIPFHKLLNGTVVKLELEFGELANGTTFHIGNSPTNDLLGGDRNSTLYNAEIYSNDTNLRYYMSQLNLCDQEAASMLNAEIARTLFLNETLSYINPRSKLIVYISEKWFRIDSVERNTTFYYNNDYLFTFTKQKLNERCESSHLSSLNKASPYLYIGLNRVIADAKLKPGSGLCSANISFLNCHLNSEPDAFVDSKNMKYKLNDESITWVNSLSYLDPTIEHAVCSGEGVLKLKFNSNKGQRVARFDLEFGETISGFTFNIGDSPTNNGYGGDSGTTSNSAEIHSNDNRFYVWLNTKYCGDTLLYKIEYSLIQSFDNLTIFISDQRIEITNHRGYYEILKNPYLYNLNGQSVTCNCFDTRCYSGVQPDDEIYFGINRVIGGTYRPGIGLCKTRISWLQCRSEVKRVDQVEEADYVAWNEHRNLTLTKEVEIMNSTETENSTAVLMADSVDNSTQIETGRERIDAQVLNITQINGHDSHQKGVPLVVSSNITVLAQGKSSKTESLAKKAEKKRSFKARK